MLQRLLLITLTLCSLSATAQWQQTGSKVRYVNGLGIPTKDTSAGVAADSSQILIRPADSSLYIKYKRTWVKVGSGGTIGGSGTTNYVAKFTAGTTLGNSQIFDNGTKVGIGYGGVGTYKFGVQYTQASNTLDGFVLNANTLAKSYGIWSANAIGGGLYGLTNPYTGFIHYTDAAATSYINDGSGYFSWHNSTAELMRLTNGGNVGIGTTSPAYKLDIRGASGVGIQIFETSTGLNNRLIINQVGNEARFTNTYSSGFGKFTWIVGGSERMRIDTVGNVGIGYTAPVAKLAVSGTTLINTNTDNGVDRLQVSGSMNVSAKATAQNLSVTNNISVTNDINQGSGTADAFYTILANSTSSGWAGRFGSRFATGAFEFQHRNNSPTFVTLATFDSPGGDGLLSVFDQLRVVDRVSSSGKGKVLINTSSDNGVDKLQVEGSISGIGMKQAYVTKTGAYTATNSDYVIDCTSGTFTVTLPASSGRTGRILIIKNSGAGTITVDGNASETIDGAATYAISVQYGTIQIMSDGTNWKIIAKF